ncbi:hypothetical protein BKA70DRAFT_1243129 [Coprinopsis sp. MPI-PUGE-AT-0042]|nr:hypothetical protein BKA70DRAFT_1243129 [Coprinopsis sp. MPI-PUGE-AT-0042]
MNTSPASETSSVGNTDLAKSTATFSTVSKASVPDVAVADQKDTSGNTTPNLNQPLQIAWRGMPTRRNIPFLSRASFHYRPPPPRVETTCDASATGSEEVIPQRESKVADNTECEVVVEE